MVIVDTSVWIDYLKDISNPHTLWLDRELERRRFMLTDLTLCEILQGTRDDLAALKVRRALAEFYVAAAGGEDLALVAAQNYRILRAKGCTVRGTIDCLIATFCLLEGYSLLHRDRDYDAFETHLGLHVIHP